MLATSDRAWSLSRSARPMASAIVGDEFANMIAHDKFEP
jgi:hypothetical protein